jgi:MarR family transcriptional regulator, organic hydroperoxide resistance regulator
LALLSKNEGMKQAELARFAGVRPSSISEVVDRLERHGLIERRRDNSDHRVFRLYLTEKGREQNERNHSSWLGFVGDLMSPLSDDEKAEYLNILKKLDKQALFLEERMEEDAKKEGENHA